MFTGEYRHSLDSKNRLIIPARLRSEIGDTFVLTRGLDGCLSIYTAPAWEKQQAQLEKLPMTTKNARAYVRFITSGAVESSFDSQGRVQLPASLLAYAGIHKTCVIIGAGDNVEIWDEEKWNAYNTATAENFDDVAESLTEFLK
jgi:MraZ protein